MKKEVCFVSIIIFLLAASVDSFAAGQLTAQASDTTGSRTQIRISANDVNNLFGFQFDVSYNPQVLSFYSVDYNGFVQAIGTSNSFCPADTLETFESGKARNIVCSLLGEKPANIPGLPLATVTFNVVSSGASDINLENVIISDINSQSINVTYGTPAAVFSVCTTAACYDNAACDDKDSATLDLCLNPGQCTASCSHALQIMLCSNGLITSQCSCGQSVYSSGYCCNGSYLAPIDCNDYDSCTVDNTYFNATSCTLQCVNTPIEGCSTGPYCGNNICESGENRKNCRTDCTKGGGGGTSQCGNGICESGENWRSCLIDCPKGKAAGEVTNNAEYGLIPLVITAQGSQGFEALINDFFITKPTVGMPSKIKFSAVHTFESADDFTVQVHILKDSELVFFSEKRITGLEPGKSVSIGFDDRWVPETEGRYYVVAILSTPDKEVNYDVKYFTYEATKAPENILVIAAAGICLIAIAIYFYLRKRRL